MHNESSTLPDIVVIKELVRSSRFVVYKAQNRTKYIILKSTAKADAMSIEMLRREYELSRTLSHPLIVNTLDFLNETPVGPAIVIEYIEGQTLDEYLAKNPSLAARHRVVRDILEAVAYLHCQAIFHNDLKASNIIINRNGTARIIDFGLSLSDDSVYKGCFGGTRGSSAPELLDGNGECSCSTDIYALGKLMNVIYEGQHMQEIIARCTSRDVSRRYQSITELQKALSWRRKRGVVIGGTAVVALLALLIVAPYIYNSVGSWRLERRRQNIERQMAPFFEEARNSAMQQELQEFVIFAKAGYYKNYYEFFATLPKEDKPLCEELFVQHIAVLDSITRAKPTISSLPTEEEQRAAIDKLNNTPIE